MNTATEHDRPDDSAPGLPMRLFLVLCSLGLFVAGGVAGALITLYWLI